MNVGFCLYDGMTLLDFAGAYDPITRLDRMGFMPMEWDLCAQTETVNSDGVTMDIDRIEPDLTEYDLVFLPGGLATRELIRDTDFIEWLQTARDCKFKTSVCTGSLLLGAAGYLDGRRATTHPTQFELLAEFATVVDDRVVHDGDVITGQGVSASIDLGLYLVELLSDGQTRTAIAEQMDYPYGPDKL